MELRIQETKDTTVHKNEQKGRAAQRKNSRNLHKVSLHNLESLLKYAWEGITWGWEKS